MSTFSQVSRSERVGKGEEKERKTAWEPGPSNPPGLLQEIYIHTYRKIIYDNLPL